MTDYDLQTLLDNNLDEEEKKHVLSIIRRNPRARKRFEKLAKEKRLINIWFKTKKK